MFGFYSVSNKTKRKISMYLRVSCSKERQYINKDTQRGDVT